MANLTLAVVGLNFGRAHARLIHSKEVNARLVAVCDLNEEYADLAQEWNASFYTDYKEMIEKERPDGVVIAVPPHLHAELAIYCLDQGVHTLVEKPITHDLESADRLIAAAERSSAKLLIGHQHRFDPGVELARKTIESNEIGPLVGFHVFGVYSKLQSYFKDEWRTKRATGGGPLASNGIHDIDRIRYICGDIESVTALMSTSYRGFEVEDTMAVTLKCKSGIVGTYYLSDASHPITDYTDYYYAAGASLRFGCSSMYPTEGRHSFESVALDDAHPAYYLRGQQITATITPATNNHVSELNHFCQVMLGAEQPRTTAEDAKKTLEVLLAVTESADKEMTIHLKRELAG